MASTRARFTISYVTLAMGAVIAFAIAVCGARGRPSPSDQVVAQATDVADGLIDLHDAQSSGCPPDDGRHQRLRA